MKLQTKNYKYLKTKNQLKKSRIFLIYNGINIENFVETGQKLKTLNVEYYRVYNSLTKKSFKNSIFKNFQPLISNTTIIIKPKMKNRDFIFNKYLELNESLHLIGLKINNKIYPTCKLNNLLQLSYKKNHLNLIKSFKNQLKAFYKLT